MSDRTTLLKYGVLALVGLIVLAGVCYALIGVGSQRAESKYTGQVVDVVEDKGILLRPSWVNMKTNARSSDIQQYCITPDREATLLPKLYDAMERGDRITITYERPLWVAPADCDPGQSIITGIEYVNTTAEGSA